MSTLTVEHIDILHSRICSINRRCKFTDLTDSREERRKKHINRQTNNRINVHLPSPHTKDRTVVHLEATMS